MALGGVSNGSSESTTDSSYFNSICPAAGTLQYMYAISGHAPGAGNSVTATIYKNGSATALTLTISGSGKAANDTSDSVSVAAGDELKLVITDSNPSYNGDFLNVDVGFQASDSGMGIVYGDENINWNPNQGHLHSGDQVISMFNIDALADTLMKFAVLRQTIGNVELKCIGAPGTGNSITATLWADGNATNVSVTVSGSNTVATDTTDTAYFDDNHLLEWKMSWTGTPATTKFGVAFTQDCR
jgi:hypothetical protein